MEKKESQLIDEEKSCISTGKIQDQDKEIKEKIIEILLDKEELKITCQDEVKACINIGDVNSAKEIMDFAEKYGIEIDLDAIKTACQKRAEECINRGNIRGIKKIMDFATENGIEIDLDAIKTAYQKKVEECINKKDIECAEKIINF
ncbi:MAG: hypothetical protein AAB526_00065, partial [Patescibacteria group bacterium]